MLDERTISTFLARRGAVKIYQDDDDYPTPRKLTLVSYKDKSTSFIYDIVFHVDVDINEYEEYKTYREKVESDILCFARYREQTIIGFTGKNAFSFIKELEESDVLSLFVVNCVDLTEN